VISSTGGGHFAKFLIDKLLDKEFKSKELTDDAADKKIPKPLPRGMDQLVKNGH
jgi:hypothetical protein